MDNFDKADVPDKYWMEVGSVVATSLEALKGGQVIVVAGENNLDVARKGLKGQLDALR